MSNYCWWFNHRWGVWKDYLLDENDGWPSNAWSPTAYRTFRACEKCGRVQDKLLTDIYRVNIVRKEEICT